MYGLEMALYNLTNVKIRLNKSHLSFETCEIVNSS